MNNLKYKNTKLAFKFSSANFITNKNSSRCFRKTKAQLAEFPPQVPPKLKFYKYLESFGFSDDHPHTTYMNVLKSMIFGGGGHLTRYL